MLTNGSEPAVPDEDDEEGEPGLVARFGVATKLRVLDAASTRIICWRSCSSRLAEWLPGIAARAIAAGSEPLAFRCSSTRTPALTANTTAIVVTRRKLPPRRPLRWP